MSDTQVTTLQTTFPRHSAGSLAIRAASTSQSRGVSSKDHGHSEDIELAVTNCGGDASRSQAPKHPDVAVDEPDNSVDKHARRQARMQYAVLCCAMFAVGWSDGTTGPLLPRIQSNYHVRSAFPADIRACLQFCTGWFCGGFSDVHIQLRRKWAFLFFPG